MWIVGGKNGGGSFNWGHLLVSVDTWLKYALPITTTDIGLRQSWWNQVNKGPIDKSLEIGRFEGAWQESDSWCEGYWGMCKFVAILTVYIGTHGSLILDNWTANLSNLTNHINNKENTKSYVLWVTL